MQLYSVSALVHSPLSLISFALQQAVEYYSGMNDEKYMYFTERIQNTLLRSEVLKLMKDSNSADENKKKEYKR